MTTTGPEGSTPAEADTQAPVDASQETRETTVYGAVVEELEAKLAAAEADGDNEGAFYLREEIETAKKFVTGELPAPKPAASEEAPASADA